MTTNRCISYVFPPLALTTLSLLSPLISPLLAQQDASRQVELPVGAEVIPQNVLMTLSGTTNPEQWQQLQEFGTPQSRVVLNRQLAQIRDRLLTANGLRYTEDIQPWVGKEMTVAFFVSQSLPSSNSRNRPASTLLSQSIVVVLPIQDKDKAKQLFEHLKPQATQKLVSRAYKGFQIKEIKGKSQGYLTTLLDDKFLVVSTNPKSLDQVIETYKGGAALATTPGFTQALSKIQASRSFGKLYINLPAAAAAFSFTNSGKPSSTQNRTQTSQNQGLAVTATVESEGVRFQSISWLKPDSQQQNKVQNTAGTMPTRLPSETMIMASGGNFRQFWTDYGQTLGANPIFPVNLRILEANLMSRLGMNLEQDFLSWMEGEFALALVAAPKGSPFPLGILLMVQASDRSAAEKSLKQLDQAVGTKYKFKVQESVIGNRSITNWILPKGGPNIIHGWMDSNVAFLNFGAPLVNTILPKPALSLTDSQPFKTTVSSSELTPNNGRFFINTDRLLGSAFPLSSLPPAARDVVSAIRAIGVTAAISDESSTRYDVLVTLSKTSRRVAPLLSPK